MKNSDYRLKLKNERKFLISRVYILENDLRDVLKYCNYLESNCRYRLNSGHIRKIKKLCMKDIID